MKKFKYALGTAAATAALALGVAMPVGATQNEGPKPPTNQSCVEESCNTETNTNTETTNVTKTYNCSIIDSNVETGAKAENEDNDKESTNSATATAGNVSLTCTTNNVTNVTNPAPQVLAAQTSAPKGGVSAGAGGAVSSSTGSIVGLVASVATAGAAFVARRKFEV